jgi:hypothetical protein
MIITQTKTKFIPIVGAPNFVEVEVWGLDNEESEVHLVPHGKRLINLALVSVLIPKTIEYGSRKRVLDSSGKQLDKNGEYYRWDWVKVKTKEVFSFNAVEGANTGCTWLYITFPKEKSK